MIGAGAAEVVETEVVDVVVEVGTAGEVERGVVQFGGLVAAEMDVVVFGSDVVVDVVVFGSVVDVDVVVFGSVVEAGIVASGPAE